MGKAKSPAALALAKKAVQARMKNLTPEERSEQARQAVQARWRRKKAADVKPGRWFGLFVCYSDQEPELIAWSRDRQELRDRSLKEGGGTILLELDFNPEKMTIVREFRPDVPAQTKALQTLLDEEKGDQE